LLAAACTVLGAQAAFAQAAPITFEAQVPPAPEKLQLFHLTPTKPPTEFLNEKLRLQRLPELKSEQNKWIARGGLAPEHAELVRAFVNPTTGDAHLIPNLAELVQEPAAGAAKPRILERETLQSTARAVLLDERFIPHDLTELRPSEAIPVMGGAATRPTALATNALATTALTPVRGEPRTVMTLVPAVRYAAGMPVYGRGSQALVTLANDGTVVGAVRAGGVRRRDRRRSPPASAPTRSTPASSASSRRWSPAAAMPPST
jgi:hypothetical protein